MRRACRPAAVVDRPGRIARCGGSAFGHSVLHLRWQMMVRIEVMELIWIRKIFYVNLEWKMLIQNFKFKIKR